MSPAPPRPGLGWREVVLSLLAALVLAAWPARKALFDPDRVLFGVDCATVQLPWSAAIEPGARAARNPDLADQGVQFYPFYRWVAKSWLDGDPPTWCPLIYAGAPGFGNAQSGALDPQVWLLVLLEALGGPAFFDWGLGLAAWLRIAAALWGAYLLARRLGLERAPAALAGITFGLSGYLVLWLNHALGHVPPLLPWVLYFLEGTRGRRPALAMAGAAFSLALAILGGHVETAFYVGAAGGFWALALLREDRRAGLRGLGALALGTACAAVSLIPTYEYLELSAAKFVRVLEADQAQHAVEFVALGVLLVLGGLVGAFRKLARGGAAAPARNWLSAGLGLGLAFGGAALLLAARGLGVGAELALVPDLFGKPGVEPLGYRGEGSYSEHASAWVSFSALAFACASLLAPAGPLGRRRLVLGLGLVAFVLAIQLPGMLELYRFVPVVGLGATVRLAPVAALMLGLLAGDALQSAPRAARTAAACVLVPLLVGVFVERGSAPLPDSVPTTPEESELVGFALTPPSRLDGEHSAFEGWLAREVALGRGRLVLEAIDAHGQALSGTAMRIPLGFFPDPSERARSEAALVVASAPEGARWFRTPFVLTGILPDGHWSFRVEFMPEGSEEAVVVRRVGVATIRRANRRDVGTILFVLAGLACLLLPSFSTRTRWVVVLLVGAQGLYFARGVNPFVPRAEVFPPTRTEELLGRELGPHRFLCDPAVLPADTGLVRGLRAIQGYDAMDVAAFNFFREYALHPGTNPLLAWNARGVDLDSPAFLLYGVKMLVLREPLEHPGWELVASPEEADAARRAETWLYRARDPLPRAFCVAQVVSLDELGELHRQDPHGWSPLELAALEEDWRPARPFTSAAVSEPVITNREVRLTAELDGDGLLVVTEQAFPGWKVYVDGEERSVLTADMIFRGVALGAGTHDVVFRYEPLSIRVGTWLSLVAAASIVVLALAGVRAGTGTGTGSGAPRRGETPG